MADESEDIVDYQEEDMYTDIAEGGEAAAAGGEEEPEEMQKRVQEMEDELDHLTKTPQDSQVLTPADKIDENSVYVGQVEYSATPVELQAHFSPCGTINRVTILCDKITGKPKGFAYVEFDTKEAMENALKLDDSVFKGRQLKVMPKRQNVPVVRGGRGRGAAGGRYPPSFRGGGRGYPAYPRGGAAAAGGYVPRGGRFPPARGGGRSYAPRGGRGGRVPAYFNSYY